MTDFVNISVADALTVAVMGYAVVFAGLIALMAVVMLCGRIMAGQDQKPAAAPAAPKAAAPAAPAAPAPAAAPKTAVAPGSAGKLKLYDTPPKDAAMIMAIVADKMGKPLNELRFLSIREVDGDPKKGD